MAIFSESLRLYKYKRCGYYKKGANMARILISMPEEFLDKIDSFADLQNRSRSELIREALRNYMQNESRPNPRKAQKTADALENLLSK